MATTWWGSPSVAALSPKSGLVLTQIPEKNQKVAIKFLKSWDFLDLEDRELQALAVMDHPNVIKIIDRVQGSWSRPGALERRTRRYLLSC